MTIDEAIAEILACDVGEEIHPECMWNKGACLEPHHGTCINAAALLREATTWAKLNSTPTS